jgi:hypothetical protein
VKKSFRLLSTILAAVIILTTVAIGFSALADGLPNSERDQLVSVTIDITSGHTIEDGVLKYTPTGTVNGGFSATVTLTAVPVVLVVGEKDAAWSPYYGYTWTVNGVVQSTTGKSISFTLESDKEYKVELIGTELSNAGVKFDSAVAKKDFTAPTYSPAGSTERLELQRQFDLAQAPSQLGYLDQYWKIFELARTNAALVIKNPAATAKDVSDAQKALEEAYGVLNDNPAPHTTVDPTDEWDGNTDYNPEHPVSVKVDGIGKFFLLIWESIKFAVWDLFLAKIFYAF